MNKYQPGLGWKHLGKGVWELWDGTRVSLLGLVRLPNEVYLSAHQSPESEQMWRLERIHGGNRKRALLTWARWKAAEFMAGYHQKTGGKSCQKIR
ncbi:MAG: hypothetical protein BWK73_09290 [Thiothrix lacustris]|uniref:Uncharacterized protein n=1 Tax=Thiothrix lacustris TaxID=525917 RepID=A0A1Y1QVZ1_9GAMM|nr:MAG: hypothetical protein BWK73_09290 [Thiothrix lacustris]